MDKLPKLPRLSEIWDSRGPGKGNFSNQLLEEIFSDYIPYLIDIIRDFERYNLVRKVSPQNVAAFEARFYDSLLPLASEQEKIIIKQARDSKTRLVDIENVLILSRLKKADRDLMLEEVSNIENVLRTIKTRKHSPDLILESARLMERLGLDALSIGGENTNPLSQVNRYKDAAKLIEEFSAQPPEKDPGIKADIEEKIKKKIEKFKDKILANPLKRLLAEKPSPLVVGRPATVGAASAPPAIKSQELGRAKLQKGLLPQVIKAPHKALAQDNLDFMDQLGLGPDPDPDTTTNTSSSVSQAAGPAPDSIWTQIPAFGEADLERAANTHRIVHFSHDELLVDEYPGTKEAMRQSLLLKYNPPQNIQTTPDSQQHEESPSKLNKSPAKSLIEDNDQDRPPQNIQTTPDSKQHEESPSKLNKSPAKSLIEDNDQDRPPQNIQTTPDSKQHEESPSKLNKSPAESLIEDRDRIKTLEAIGIEQMTDEEKKEFVNIAHRLGTERTGEVAQAIQATLLSLKIYPDPLILPASYNNESSASTSAAGLPVNFDDDFWDSENEGPSPSPSPSQSGSSMPSDQRLSPLSFDDTIQKQ